MPAELPSPLHFANQKAWQTWLQKHHATSTGEWLRFAKAKSPHRSVTYKEAVESALCYGWIDGLVRRLDDDFFIQRYTPRKPASVWSRINREKALDLIQRGAMQPAGLAAIETAKSNGRWDAAYEPASTAEVPTDLQQALKANPEAAKFFKTLTGQNRYAILFRLQTTRTPATRTKTLAKFVAMLERGETLH